RQRLQAIGRVPVAGRLGLIAEGVEMLPKIPAMIEEGHADHAEADVGRRPQRVASQDAEPAAVAGDGRIEAGLHGEVGDGGEFGDALGNRHRTTFLSNWLSRTSAAPDAKVL